MFGLVLGLSGGVSLYYSLRWCLAGPVLGVLPASQHPLYVPQLQHGGGCEGEGASWSRCEELPGLAAPGSAAESVTASSQAARLHLYGEEEVLGSLPSSTKLSSEGSGCPRPAGHLRAPARKETLCRAEQPHRGLEVRPPVCLHVDA